MKNYTIEISGKGTMKEILKSLENTVKALKDLEKVGETDSLFFDDEKLVTKINEKKLEIMPLRETGSGRTGTLTMNFSDIVEKVFKPNVTSLDDKSKVKASWGITDSKKRKAFIWSYKFYGDVKNCNSFSVCGDFDLLKEIFGDAVSKDKF